MNGRYNNPMKQCPFCGEAIMANAVKCRFCQEFLDNASSRAKPCMFCGENLDINATVCDYCGEFLVPAGTGQGRPGVSERQDTYQAPLKPLEQDERSGFSTYRLPPVGDDFFPYEELPPAVERCNCCGEQLLSLEEGACPFCGNVFADTMVKKSSSPSGKECPFCGEFNEPSSIRCTACGEIMKISFGTKGTSAKASYSDDVRGNSVKAPYSDKGRTESRGVEKSVVTGNLERECLLCGEKNPINAVKCRVCHEIFSDEKQSPVPVKRAVDSSQEVAKKRESLLTPSKILTGTSTMQKKDAYPVSQSKNTRQFGSRPASGVGREEMQKLCPLCGEKNPLSASYCKLCCEELKDKEPPKAEIPSIAPKESVKKSIVTGDLQRECLLCGEKNPVTAVKCRICDEVFDIDGTEQEVMQKQQILPEDTGEDDYIPEKPSIPRIAQEKPKVRKKSHWETTPGPSIDDIKPSPLPVTKFKEDKKIGIKKSPADEVKVIACSVCGSKLSPSGECPDCEHKQAELEKLVKSPKKKTTIYPIIITGVGIIFIVALLSVIGTFVYPIVSNILSRTPKPTEVASAATPAEPTAVPATPVVMESPAETPGTAVTPTPVPTSAAVPTSVVITKVSFVDIEDNFAKNYIIALQKLGIFKEIDGNKFKPYDRITRGQYTRWFVTSANILCPEQAINNSMATLSKNYYDDVQPDYLDFTYIQFLHDRGYVVGIDGTHFEPDKELTREELMMIRCSFEYDIQFTDIRDLNHTKCISDLQNYFRDPNDINNPYLVSFYKDMPPGFPVLNRTFGNIKKIYPKAPVTRSEAAASLGEILGKSAEETVEKLLASPSPSASRTPAQ
ncbi:MAG: S-layer homology domain-containing protein [Candidatus Eremiobacterota bacterium]